MAFLGKEKIKEAISNKDIIISVNGTPLPAEKLSIGAASIDLSLDNVFRYYTPGLRVVPVHEETDSHLYQSLTEKVVVPDGESFLLSPGQACLGITRERVTLKPTICGLLDGRSRFARLGLLAHLSCGFMNPGIDNQQVLEIFNASNHPLALYPGTKICQFMFCTCEGAGTGYHGNFNGQTL